MVASMTEFVTVASLQSLVAAGPAAFGRKLGGFVLLGHIPESGADWVSRTSVVTTSKSVRAVRRATGELEAMIDLGWQVFVVRKAPGTQTDTRTVLIGRSSSNDIVLPHSSVSKLHARIDVSPTGLVLSDAGSSNGTIFNGDQLRANEEVTLASGDLIRFGSVALQLFSPEVLCSLLTRYS
jgi:hypothetical protein